jgi:ketopantoate reductase
VITHSGTLQGVEFGESDGSRSERVRRLLATFVEARIDAQISDHITRAIREKFVLLVGLSGTRATPAS